MGSGNRARTVEIYTEVCRASFDPRLTEALEHVERFRCDVESAGWVLRCAMDEVLEPSGKGNWALNKAIQKGVPFSTVVCLQSVRQFMLGQPPLMMTHWCSRLWKKRSNSETLPQLL